MAGENNEENREIQTVDTENINEGSFLLFLVFILLLMGTQDTFNIYFQLFDDKITKLSNILNAFQATANGLQGVFSTSSTLE